MQVRYLPEHYLLVLCPLSMVLGEDTNTCEIYNEMVSDMVESATKEGINGTVFIEDAGILEENKGISCLARMSKRVRTSAEERIL